MITKEGRLVIFERFVVDHRLPKFNKQRRKQSASQMKQMSSSSFVGEDSDGEDENMSMDEWQAGRVRFSRDRGVLVTTGSIDPNIMAVPFQATSTSWYERMLRWFRSPPQAGALSPPPEPEPTLTIEEFFVEVKNSTEEIRLVQERLQGYQKALEDAIATGQQALCERLALDIEAVRAETQLHAIGLPKYLEEEPVVRFYKESPRGLRLDWIANFLRVVPADIREKKVRCDELGVFDNYAVMHYDPETKAYAETQEEIRAKQDPILFGVLQGRRRLYYVGDWIDETCNLTLEQIADRLGAAAVSQITPEWQP